MKVIVDTNALILSAKFGVDLFSELNRLGYEKVLVPGAVVKELKGLSNDLKGKEKTAVSVSLSFLDRCEIVEGNGIADDIILKLAKEKGAAVFTNDKKLKERLLKEGVVVVIIRQKRYLSFGKI